jgi:GntR family transcriptional regulator, rspAB operon transcriptional repressor
MPVDELIEESTDTNKKRRVYEILRTKIVHNELKPSEYLNEQNLCQDLGVSKTPIREALQRLEHNRLVVIVPNKGCFVSNISIDRIREVFEIRAILECAAARLAAASDNRSQFKSILESHDSFNIQDGEEMRHYLLSGYQIHTHIVEAAGNSYLTDFYKTILDHIVQIRVYFLNRFKSERLHETVEEHKRILQAIVDGDVDGAESAMRDHLKRSLLNINQLMLGNRMDK